MTRKPSSELLNEAIAGIVSAEHSLQFCPRDELRTFVPESIGKVANACAGLMIRASEGIPQIPVDQFMKGLGVRWPELFVGPNLDMPVGFVRHRAKTTHKYLITTEGSLALATLNTQGPENDVSSLIMRTYTQPTEEEGEIIRTYFASYNDELEPGTLQALRRRTSYSRSRGNPHDEDSASLEVYTPDATEGFAVQQFNTPNSPPEQPFQEQDGKDALLVHKALTQDTRMIVMGLRNFLTP
jgi:hypothetical protein